MHTNLCRSLDWRRALIYLAVGVFMFSFLLVAWAHQGNMKQISSGVWGGQGVTMQVEGVSATLDYDCAHGAINGPLNIDTEGKFDLRGTYVRETSGPVRGDQPLTQSQVRYIGWTDGKKMEFTVTQLRTNNALGKFTLEKDRHGRVRKCR